VIWIITAGGARGKDHATGFAESGGEGFIGQIWPLDDSSLTMRKRAARALEITGKGEAK